MRSLATEPYFIPTNFHGGLAGLPDRVELRGSSLNQSYSDAPDYTLDIGLAAVPGLPTKQGYWRIWRNENLDISAISPLPIAGVDVAVYDLNEGFKARHLIVGIGGAGFSTEDRFKQVLEASTRHLIERPGYFHLPRGVGDSLVGFTAGAAAGLVVGVEVGSNVIINGAENQGGMMIVGGLLGFSIGGFVGNGLSELDQRRVARKIPNASEYRANRRAFDNLWILRNQLTAAMTFSEVLSGLGERSQGLPDNAIWKIYASEGKIAKLAERRIMERRQEKDPGVKYPFL